MTGLLVPIPQDLQGLQLEVDGVTRSWADWTSHYVDSYYPRVGQDCYRVPAVHFNQQNLTRGDTSWGDTFHVLHPPVVVVLVIVRTYVYASVYLLVSLVSTCMYLERERERERERGERERERETGVGWGGGGGGQTGVNCMFRYKTMFESTNKQWANIVHDLMF